MPIWRLCRTVCAAGLIGTMLLLAGCNDKPVDKTGPAVEPQNMDAAKQKQYDEFMKSRGKGGGGGPPGPPSAPGGAPGAPR